ncbi:hypothetical protein J5X91_17390 [Pseudoalteromonas sp. K222D]|uniref:P-loop NTPase fold protein n=1 Tax=Pseudoalteromonas sp. K222D TaxID=2820756 RepID=UPI001AD789C2|nr:P-loop NTPase fold protein [Pseudoalteromonas sp. K222D]MBO7928017.1 hypothetical protein [Pseudoalteromonas sp. K222D]
MDNENNNSDYKFLIEKPSQKDLFDSGSHSRTAMAVFKALKGANDINVVGVEGNLGSGKSTVLELIKDMSKEEQYEFVEFDVERFQHGATKKALIEKLYSAIEGSIKSEKKGIVKKAKNVALGNHFEYTSNIKSNINIWIIWFTIALLVGVRLLPEALIGVSNFLLYIFYGLTGGFEVANGSFNFSGLALLAIILAWFPCHIVRCAQKSRKILWLFGTPPTTGDIFKRNSKDTISETIEINKEVGAYELQQALESFVNEIPEEKRFILVLDNLDRVTNEKLREVWSDIEVFTSIAQTKIQLLIPYSIKHIASSISSDEAEGIEFISKRIPISFRVAPILSADWKRSFSGMIRETGLSVKGEELKGILSLFDLWTYAFNTQVTPRFMKKLTNSIVSILSTHNEAIHVITAFYYQLSVQNYGLSSTDILSSETKENSIQDKLQESKKIIERTINFELWSKEFVSIHYLSSYNVAESEILTSPLSRALESGDIEPFIAKQNIYAYDKILSDLIDDKGTDKFISLMLSMKESEDEKYTTWVDKWSSHINSAIEKDTFDIEDIEALVSSTKQLSDLGIDVNKSRIKNYYKSNNKTPSEVLELKDIDTNLEILYACSQLLKYTPNIIKSFNEILFIEHLWPKRKAFPNWKVGVGKLKEVNIQSLFFVANKAQTIDKELLEYISSFFKIGWLNEEEKTIELYLSMPEVESINNGISILESNIYLEEWYRAEQQSYYQRGITAIEEQYKTKWLAQAVSNIVYHKTPEHIRYYESYIILDSEFHNELANCLAVSCEFDMLISSLENESLSKYVAEAIKILLVKKRVNKLILSQVIEKYDTIKAINIEPSAMLIFFNGWIDHYKFTLKNLEGMNKSFLNDVINIKAPDLWRDKILKIIDNEANMDWWLKQIEKPSNTIKLIVDEWYVKNNKSFIKCGSLNDSLTHFFTELSKNNMENYSNKTWIDSLISILPKTSCGKLSRALNKLIGLPSTSSKEAKCIIANCGNYVELQGTMKSESILILFENIVSNQEIATWFDIQNIGFEKWDGNLVSSFVTEMISLEEVGLLFENLNKVTVIEEAKKSLLTQATEQ